MRVEPSGSVPLKKRHEGNDLSSPLCEEDTARRHLSTNQRQGPSPHNKSAGTLITDLRDSRTVRNKCCLSHPVCQILLQQPKLTKTTSQPFILPRKPSERKNVT